MSGRSDGQSHPFNLIKEKILNTSLRDITI